MPPRPARAELGGLRDNIPARVALGLGRCWHNAGAERGNGRRPRELGRRDHLVGNLVPAVLGPLRPQHELARDAQARFVAHRPVGYEGLDGVRVVRARVDGRPCPYVFVADPPPRHAPLLHPVLVLHVERAVPLVDDDDAGEFREERRALGRVGRVGRVRRVVARPGPRLPLHKHRLADAQLAEPSAHAQKERGLARLSPRIPRHGAPPQPQRRRRGLVE
mmetsp:Transcript_9194/g.26927  ORF Transcript_9194/g.26927 Transcript_9194/m.26927 type:complete len:220 (-) Transcript_9194:522-1181(-)